MRKVTHHMESSNNITKKHTICFVAGQSGGHIVPCITLAQQMRTPETNIIFFSTNSPLDKALVQGIGDVVTHYIPLPLRSIPYKAWYKMPLFLWQSISSFVTSLRMLHRYKPEKVITTGSHIAIPVCLAAKLLRIPIELYEFNVIPGKTITFLAPLAQKIWLCFEATKKHLPANKCILTTYPVKFSAKDSSITKQEALQTINFHPDRTTILILGGSQGSLFINALMKQLIETYPHLKQQLQIIHQTGSLDATDWNNFYNQYAIPAIVFAYQDALAPYYAAADLVVCRAGAGTLAEVIFFKKSCVTIPLETTTTTHQVDNAVAVAQQYPQFVTVIKQLDLPKTAQELFQYLQQQFTLK